MKVFYIITNLSTGGAEMMLYKLLTKINRERFEPAVVSLVGMGTLGEPIEALGIPVYSIGMQPGKPTIAALWQLNNLLHQLKPDLVQGWMYHGNLAAQLASSFSSVRQPVLWSIHHSLYALTSEKKMTAAVIRLCGCISKLPTKVIFVSKISKLQHEALGYCSENSCVIPNGFNTTVFIPSAEAKLSVRSELGLDEESLLIGLIGRYHPLKDHVSFLKAAALLLQINPSINFVLVGREVDYNNQDLRSLLEEIGLEKNVHLLGERNDIPRLTAALDIACSSSVSEAFPLAIGEAMSCGVPCVVTDVGDSAWIVGDTGRVVPPRDTQAFVDAWKYLIDLGGEGRKVLGQTARARIIQYFSLESVVSQYEALYESVMAQGLN